MPKANDREFAADRQGTQEYFQCLSGQVHPVSYAHATAAVNNENEVQPSTICQLRLNGFFALNDLEEVLRLLGVESWNERDLNGELVVAVASELKLRVHHVEDAVVDVDGSSRLRAADQHSRMVFVLRDDSGIGWDA